MNAPYFCEPVGDFVFDEMCECGHLRSEHGSLTLPIKHSNKRVRVHDHGSCCASGCACTRFTWTRFIFTDEYAEKVMNKRLVSV
jgi:hypothetical protein